MPQPQPQDRPPGHTSADASGDLPPTLVDGTPDPPPEATLPLPVRDQDAVENRTPVDPWAGADLWTAHTPPPPQTALSDTPPPGPYPPTRPYPVLDPPPADHSAPPAPAAGPYPPAKTYPPTRPYPVLGPPAANPPAPPAPAGRPLPAVPAPPAGNPVKRGRRSRRASAPYGPPPPGWRPPPGYVAVAVRRRRRWPWFLLFSIACCCGVPTYWAAPLGQQYPATAGLPDRVADLRLQEDATSTRATQRLERDLAVTYWAADPFAGVYSSSSGKRVMIFGVTGFRLSPEEDVDAEIGRLTPDYDIVDTQKIKTRTRGEYARCGTGRAAGTGVVICTWADHGSIVTGMFTRLSVDDSRRLLGELRTSILTRG